MKKDLPIYDIKLTDDTQGVGFISLVDEPAIGVDWIKLAKVTIKEPKVVKSMMAKRALGTLDGSGCFGCPPNGDGTRVNGEPDARCKGDGSGKTGGSKGGSKGGGKSSSSIPKEGEVYDISKLNQEKANNGTLLVQILGPEYKNPELRQSNVDNGMCPVQLIDGTWIQAKSTDPRAGGYGNKKLDNSPFYQNDVNRVVTNAETSRTKEEDSKISHPLNSEQESFLKSLNGGKLRYNKDRNFGFDTIEENGGTKIVYKNGSESTDVATIKNGRLTPSNEKGRQNGRRMDELFKGKSFWSK